MSSSPTSELGTCLCARVRRQGRRQRPRRRPRRRNDHEETTAAKKTTTVKKTATKKAATKKRQLMAARNYHLRRVATLGKSTQIQPCATGLRAVARSLPAEPGAVRAGNGDPLSRAERPRCAHGGLLARADLPRRHGHPPCPRAWSGRAGDRYIDSPLHRARPLPHADEMPLPERRATQGLLTRFDLPS